MDEVAKVTSSDPSFDAFKLMPTTLGDWVSSSLSPEISVDFDEPVTILDVVLRPKYAVTDASSQFMKSQEGKDQFEGAEPENFSFKNFTLSQAGRFEPQDMSESFKSVK